MRSRKILARLLVMFALLTILGPTDGLAEPLDHWQERNFFPPGISVRVCYGNGMFLALGARGTFHISADGLAWTSRNSETDLSLYDAAYGRSVFVAVGESGTILTSPDGLNWTSPGSATSHHLSGVAYGNGTFVAVGENGTILSSSDGDAWTVRSSGTHHWLKKVAWSDKTFVAVGDSGTILTSSDGAVWAAAGSQISGHLDGIAYGGGTFVAVGDTILTSADGFGWTERATRNTPHLFGVAYGGGTFATVGDNGSILTSSDGAVWEQRDSGTHSTLLSIVQGDKKFIAAGENGSLVQSDSLPSPRISVSATSLDFGSVNVGNSFSQNLTITNAGSADLIIRQLTIGGTNSPDFTTQNNNCSGTTLGTSQNCTVQIVFSPVFTGSKNATLSISSNDPNTPTQTVSLSGNSSGISVSFSGSFCFISLMARGSGLENYLNVLRKFRDVILLRSHPGKNMVDFYYRHSPALVRHIAPHGSLRKVVAFGSIPPLLAVSYVALYTSPVERAFLVALTIGLMTEGFILRRRTRWAKGANRGKSN